VVNWELVQQGRNLERQKQRVIILTGNLWMNLACSITAT
jgi:hypothetical protein